MDAAIEQMLSRLPKARVAVLGDVGVDRYWVVDHALRYPSQETGQPIQQVVDTWVSPGGAGTVVSQLCALGVGQVGVISIVGNDPEGLYIRKAFEAMNVDSLGIFVCEGRITPSYNRVLSLPHLAEYARYDVFSRQSPSNQDVQAILASLEKVAKAYDVLVVSDYTEPARPGIITPDACAAVSEFARKHWHLPVIVDSRMQAKFFRWTCLKINAGEFATLVGLATMAKERLISEGRALASRQGRPLVVTLGHEGALVFSQDGVAEIPTFTETSKIDIVGAGDAVLAGFAAGMATKSSAVDAAVLGVLVASITVEHLHKTGAATPQQVRNRWQEWRSRFGEPRWLDG